MHSVLLAPASETWIGQGDQTRTERWSRTVGALGQDGWVRLSRLHYAVVGVGRSGSLLADAVACGWGAGVTLIDPDRLEMHNLGEMAGVGTTDLGRPKALAVARGLRRRVPAGSPVEAVAHSATRLPALHALRHSDVIVGCVDHDGARLALAALAVLFCKPYLDVATGIHGTGDSRRMGADIRLVVPGEHCLLCLGGLADLAGAQRALTSADTEGQFVRSRSWRLERTGSLRSLNHLAVGLALRLWEDFITERLRGSTWLRAEVDPAGRPAISHSPGTVAGCPLCPLLAQGEEGLERARAFFRDGSVAIVRGRLQST
jgi:molybdopterin/thiamine biosynthesis adenylyltransferase